MPVQSINTSDNYFVNQLGEYNSYILSREELQVIGSIQLSMNKELSSSKANLASKQTAFSNKKQEVSDQNKSLTESLKKFTAKPSDQSSEEAKKLTELLAKQDLLIQKELSIMEKEVEKMDKDTKELEEIIGDQNNLFNEIMLLSRKVDSLVKEVFRNQENITKLNAQIDKDRLEKKKREWTFGLTTAISGVITTTSTLFGGSVFIANTAFEASVFGGGAAATGGVPIVCAVIAGLGIYVGNKLYSKKKSLEEILKTDINPIINQNATSSTNKDNNNKVWAKIGEKLQHYFSNNNDRTVNLLIKFKDIFVYNHEKITEFTKIRDVAIETFSSLKKEQKLITEGLQKANGLNTAGDVLREVDPKKIIPGYPLGEIKAE